MSDVESELRRQLREAFAEAEFPVTNQMELVPVLPQGITTTFEAGDVRISAMELGSKLSEYQSFPYENRESLIDDIIAGLRAEDVI